MKRKNGYTVIELIVIIVILGVMVIFITSEVLKSFKTDTEGAYNSRIEAILARSKVYGEDNIDEVKKNETGITITVDRLIENKYLAADKNGDLSNPKNKNSNLNDLKVNIRYDEKTESIISEIVE